jgi:tetratricopeptide (TPR) repeat protein
MDSRQVLARFEAERQALALMDHVNIARVFDGGTTESGRPYFVMELVKGVSITQYCDDNHLTPRQRLELFVPVCQAIQHAHQKGIIHRDIKPSNVMVTLYDGKPVPKVIDFGVAKATEQKLTDRTLFTQYGGVVGTLEYMSPEQAEMSALGVDTRSDVYSLGVLLYELLTGSTPLDPKRMKQAAFAEILRRIKEEDPPRPSTRLSDSGEALASISAQRQMEPARLTRLVRGELDWIVMKCLEKDRGRRYETASAFAADVQRYLADEPVQACPPSARYRLGKFARRNKRALATAAVLTVAVLGAAGALGWAMRDREANAQQVARERAEREVAIQAEVTAALNDAERWQQGENWPEALSAVKRAEGFLAGAGSDELQERVRLIRKDLEVVIRLEEIRLLATDWEGDRFHYEASDRAYAQAFADYGVDILRLSTEEAGARLRARPGVVVPLVAALDDWAYVRRAIERVGSAGIAMTAVAQAIDPDPWRRQVRVARHQKDSKSLAALATSPELSRQPPASLQYLAMAAKLRGRADLRMDVLRQAQQRYPGDFWINFDLAMSLSEQRPQRPGEAIAFLRAALAVRPRSIAVLNNLGLALHDDGKPAEAVQCFREAIAINPRFARAYANLARSLAKVNKTSEAIALDEAIADYRSAIRMEPDSANAHNGLGVLLEQQQKLEEAITEYRTAIRFDPKNAIFYCNLGRVLRAQGKPGEAVAACRKAVELESTFSKAHNGLGLALYDQGKLDEAIDSFQKAIKTNPRDTAPLNNLGNSLKQQRKLPEAIAAFRDAIRLDPSDATLYRNLGAVLRVQGKPGEAVAFLRKAVELDQGSLAALYDLSIALTDSSLPNEGLSYARKAIQLDKGSAFAHSALAHALAKLARYDDAIAAYREVIKLDPKNGSPHNGLGNIFRAQKKLDDAVAAYRKATELEPKSAPFRNNLGLALDAQEKLDEALACCRKAIELDPKFAAAHSGLGSVLGKQQKTGDAVAAYREAARLDPSSALYLRNLGYQLRIQGSLDEAIAVYREAIKLEPTSALAYYGLGRALSSKGRAEEATVAFHEALRLNATAEHRSLISVELNNRAWRLAVNPDPAARHPRRALELATEVIELQPREGNYFNTLGVAHYRTGNWKDAVAALSRGMELRNGGDGVDWFFLAMTHWKLGDRDEARKWYDKAVAWTDKHQPGNDELRRFRAEAAELLGVAVEVAPLPRQKK